MMQNRVVPLPSAVLSVHSSKQVFMCVYRCKHAAHRAERVSVHILPIGRKGGCTGEYLLCAPLTCHREFLYVKRITAGEKPDIRVATSFYLVHEYGFGFM